MGVLEESLIVLPVTFLGMAVPIYFSGVDNLRQVGAAESEYEKLHGTRPVRPYETLGGGKRAMEQILFNLPVKLKRYGNRTAADAYVRGIRPALKN